MTTRTTISTATSIALLVLLMAQQYRQQPQPLAAPWPILGTQATVLTINPHRLVPAMLGKHPTIFDPYASSLKNARTSHNLPTVDGAGQPIELLRHTYRYVRVAGHYRMGTTVLYLPQRNSFYLNGDCAMGHMDTMVGPFRGDPRVVLPTVVEVRKLPWG